MPSFVVLPTNARTVDADDAQAAAELQRDATGVGPSSWLVVPMDDATLVDFEQTLVAKSRPAVPAAHKPSTPPDKPSTPPGKP